MSTAAKDIYQLQERWLAAASSFDSARTDRMKKSAIAKMRAVLRDLEKSGAKSRELGAYRGAYERYLEKAHGARIPRHCPTAGPKKATKKKKKK